MRIGIIGAGIAGTALALAARQRDWDVDLFEAAPEFQEVGAGLQISANGMRVLQALGLKDRAEAESFGSYGVTLFDYTGRKVAILPNGNPEMFRLFHRADLLGVLASAVQDQGAAVHLNARVTAEDLTGYDLIVGADGLHSALRQEISPAKPQFTGQVAWRAMVEVPKPINAGGAAVYMGPRRHIVIYPLRRGTLLNIVAIEERDTWEVESWTQEGNLERFRARFADFRGPIPGILSQVQRVMTWGLCKHPVADIWHDGARALIGDAAHATLPFLAQGANMALEDAYVLPAALAVAGDIPSGLARYQALRQARCRRIVAEASANAGRFHMANPLLRRVAHLGLSLGSNLTPGVMRRRYKWLYDYDVTSVT